ncbi:MAG: hypothetical protein M2R45_03850 [Verrucomicrobia subdivision 3 bacterium]|nr:hypothetical protein [Limisphaerales bacterium]MCS1415806.1 hypothetical protein [Limisphaerales bacterium]
MVSCTAALKSKSCKVTGFDQGAYSPMATFLETQDIAIRSPHAEKIWLMAPTSVLAHTRQEHHNFPDGMGLRIRWTQPKFPHRRHAA